MQPRLTTQSSEARSCTIGNAITLPESCSIAQVSSHSGRGDGVCFMKNHLPVNAVGVALHHHRAVAQMRQQNRGDVGVVLEQIALGETELGPEDLSRDWSAVPSGPRSVRTSFSARWAAELAAERSGRLGVTAAGPVWAAAGRAAPPRPPAGRSAPSALRAARSRSAPRLMSPRPTNSTGKRSRSPSISRSTSTYFPVATLPSSTTSRSSSSSSRRRSRLNGVRYSGRSARMSTVPNSRRSRAPISVSGGSSPRSVVMTCTPACPSGGTGEVGGVGQLSPEIESTEEAERLTQGDARRPKPLRQGKSRPFVEQNGGALAATVRGREKKDSPCGHQS